MERLFLLAAEAIIHMVQIIDNSKTTTFDNAFELTSIELLKKE